MNASTELNDFLAWVACGERLLAQNLVGRPTNESLDSFLAHRLPAKFFYTPAVRNLYDQIWRIRQAREPSNEPSKLDYLTRYIRRMVGTVTTAQIHSEDIETANYLLDSVGAMLSEPIADELCYG